MSGATLTPAEHDLFDAFVEKWQDRLGLKDWRIERSTKPTRYMADVTIEHSSRLAHYRLGPFGAAPVTPESIEATALHELLHVLLAELVNQVDYGITGTVLESAEHRVVHVLEKLLMRVPA